MTFKKVLLLLALVAAPLGMTATGANAAGNFMDTGSRTTQPVGHYYLCQKQPEECGQKTANPAPISLSRSLWQQMIDVNNAVNTEVAPLTDMEIWGQEEVWSYPTTVGDCEDYVLEKRRRLVNFGVPVGNLLITVVKQPNGAGHAVLSVTTDRGDYILDNLAGRVVTWNETPYTYLKRQSPRNTGEWLTITNDRAVAVGSVK